MIEVVVTFDLEDASPAQYAAARRTLRSLGFKNVMQGIHLPSTTFVGTWMLEAAPLSEIRDSLVVALVDAGTAPKNILVAAFSQLAFMGDQVPPALRRPSQ